MVETCSNMVLYGLVESGGKEDMILLDVIQTHGMEPGERTRRVNIFGLADEDEYDVCGGSIYQDPNNPNLHYCDKCGKAV